MRLHAASRVVPILTMLLGACTDEFPTEPAKVTVDDSLPRTRIMTVLDTDTLVARLRTSDGRLVGAAIRWTSSDPAKLELREMSVTGGTLGDTLLARTRIEAFAHARASLVVVTATVEQPGVKTFSVEDSIKILEHWDSVTAGGGYTCGLTITKDAYCWGSLPIGTEQAGKGLGTGSTDGSDKPVRVLGGLKFKAISAGDLQTCALTADTGQLYCWGRNLWGALGDGTFADALAPRPAAGGHNFQQISTSSSLTCGVTAADFLEGRIDRGPALHNVLCWGRRSLGGLGHGARFVDSLFSLPCRLQKEAVFICMPRLQSAVTAALTGNILLRSVSVGNGFACGIARDGLRDVHDVHDGDALCWGLHDADQLGLALTLDTVGVQLCQGIPGLSQFEEAPCSFNPLRASTGLTFSALSSGGPNTCGVSGGQVYCWGDKYGDTPRVINAPVGAQVQIASISVGGDRIEVFGSSRPFIQGDESPFMCALANGGQAFCWGDNVAGELGSGEEPGDSPIEHQNEMQRVDQDTLSFKAVSAGSRLVVPRQAVAAAHACGVNRDGGIFCWGSNRSGALGISRLIPGASTPQRVVEPDP